MTIKPVRPFFQANLISTDDQGLLEAHTNFALEAISRGTSADRLPEATLQAAAVSLALVRIGRPIDADVMAMAARQAAGEEISFEDLPEGFTVLNQRDQIAAELGAWLRDAVEIEILSRDYVEANPEVMALRWQALENTL